MHRANTGTRGPAPWIFLVATLLWTWLTLGLVVLSGQHYLQFPWALLMLLGGLGPLLVSAVLVRLGRWDGSLDATAARFLLRALDPRTLSVRWWLVLGGLLAAYSLLPVVLDRSALGEHGLLEFAPTGFLLIGFVFGALEEIGWRGYAQEGLQRRMPIIAAGLIIGLFWSLWHLPLFFIEGTYQAGLGFGTAAFWSYMGSILLTSPLYAWLYNASGGAILLPLLFHGLGNVLGELTPTVASFLSLAVQVGITYFLVGASWRWMRKKAGAALDPGPS